MCRLFLFYFLLVGIIYGGEVHAQVDLTPQMTNKIKGVQYSINYNTKCRIPEMVYYIVYNDSLDSYGRSSFYQSKLKDSAVPWDYAYTGYDIGHMQSSASSNNKTAMIESFDMINVTPQLPSFNRGIWKKTEAFERKNCDPYCYVIAGDLTVDSVYINEGRVLVPDIYYKVIYNPSIHQMIGFILHKDSSGDIKSKAVPVIRVESIIKKKLFTQLTGSDYVKLKSRIDLTKWKW